MQITLGQKTVRAIEEHRAYLIISKNKGLKPSDCYTVGASLGLKFYEATSDSLQSALDQLEKEFQ